MNRFKCMAILMLFSFHCVYQVEASEQNKSPYIIYTAPLKSWEPSNDDMDSGKFNWNGFHDIGYTQQVFLNIQELSKVGMPIHILINEKPDWMDLNFLGLSVPIASGWMSDELVESVCAFLVRLRDSYGVTVESVTFQGVETDGASLLMKGSTKSRIARKAGARFDALGITAKIIVADAEGAVKGETDLENNKNLLPDHFAIEQNFPNPFNPETQIQYQLSEDAKVRIDIYNLLGQKVHTLVNEKQKAGYYNLHWDGLNDSGIRVASGVYLYRITAEGKSKSFGKSMKMLLLK